MDIHTKKAMRNIIVAQCAGVPASIFYSNGVMLAFLSSLGFSSAVILQLLALPNFIALFVMIPAALLSDRYGKKIWGNIGLLGTVVGFACVAFAGNGNVHYGKFLAILGNIIFGIGLAMFNSNWFALLSPIIPENIIGRFFGKLRFSWQFVSIVLTLVTTVLLNKFHNEKLFQYIFIFIVVTLFVRFLFYLKIPELEKPTMSKLALVYPLKQIIKSPGFMPFCSYTFLLTLCTGACPWLFGLLEKDVLHFTNTNIVLMGTLLLTGSLIGFILGGRMVDKRGTRYVFLNSHLSYGLVLLMFLFRDFIPVSELFYIGLLTMFFGFIQAASGIAITSELLSVIPVEYKSLSTAFATTLTSSALALSSLAFSQMLNSGMLTKEWYFFSLPMSQYDSIFLICSLLIILFIVTLGLIPSVIKSAQWIPRSGMLDS